MVRVRVKVRTRLRKEEWARAQQLELQSRFQTWHVAAACLELAELLVKYGVARSTYWLRSTTILAGVHLSLMYCLLQLLCLRTTTTLTRALSPLNCSSKVESPARLDVSRERHVSKPQCRCCCCNSRGLSVSSAGGFGRRVSTCKRSCACSELSACCS